MHTRVIGNDEFNEKIRTLSLSGNKYLYSENSNNVCITTKYHSIH